MKVNPSSGLRSVQNDVISGGQNDACLVKSLVTIRIGGSFGKI
jgi:hypothetical protein